MPSLSGRGVAAAAARVRSWAARARRGRELDDRGSSTVTVIAVIVLVMVMTATMMSAAQLLMSRAQARAAADHAALAGAMVARERGTGADGDACREAEHAATVNGAAVEWCQLDGLVVTVAVSAGDGPLVAHASAVAGPAWAGWP